MTDRPKFLEPRDFDAWLIESAALDAIAAFDHEQSRRIGINNDQVTGAVAKSLAPEWYAASGGAWSGDRFSAKVKRVLDKLAAAGTIVKISGAAYGGGPVWLTPEQWAASEQRKADAEATRARQQEVARAMRKRAARAGIEIQNFDFEITSRYGARVTVPFADFEKLLDLYERSGMAHFWDNR